jgi:thiamine-phosphate pyrophosphorylase
VTGASPLAQRLTLMVITDPAAPAGALRAARLAVQGGATAVQVRWKGSTTRDLLELTRAIGAAARDAGALLIVNDRLDVALAADADGAHLGGDDLPLAVARRLAPTGFLLGRSVDTGDEAVQAQAEGADYVGLGPVFPTATKADAGPVVGEAGIRAVRARVRLPIVAIGGLDVQRAAAVVRAGADGIAVCAAVMASPDPRAATAALSAELRLAGTPG